MTEADVRAAVAEQRRYLTEVLGGLDEAGWDSPTLCEGWRVREVVAHITMPYRLSLPGFVLGMIKARGDFNRMSDRSARADAAELTSSQLLTCLHDNVNHPWKPPGGGFVGALSHDVIHGLDITVGLGRDDVLPEHRLRPVLESVRPKQVKYFGVDLTGVQLRADDLDWTFGTGTPLTGRAQDLLLVLSGRTLPAGHLHGPAADRFSAVG
ncbi:maleylpyruvate isomerase family mycothiol-dependent enzyme [Nocardia cyriacigeorgica]|uniref:maleylpyruvate isomerase family mycothiol-dependent enzyme n=1 Tax=Nocardia cyriacigeorgica TaxID=135487 RepID=UPI0018944C36|nr:maleylpyruvate isomerase family mycothiol-dependent enzyme [Nocardia cyriacigeorgica]MBF6089818.1 maleylpyruvate isomerase family mycothiol-dependent enzyme [Nocardia cyriacigeorgica]MBF6095063.1 maleylpyruvate isomerase family mycothiol-dependent enzyme [Nocardia cyriacigeorgica]